MPELPISQVLPGRLMHRALRADVIDYLIAAPLKPTTKRRLFHRWCEFVNDKPRREELERIAPKRSAVKQADLYSS